MHLFPNYSVDIFGVNPANLLLQAKIAQRWNSYFESEKLFICKYGIILHGQHIICSKTHLDGITHEQTIICGQLSPGHVVDLQPMKMKSKYIKW